MPGIPEEDPPLDVEVRDEDIPEPSTGRASAPQIRGARASASLETDPFHPGESRPAAATKRPGPKREPWTPAKKRRWRVKTPDPARVEALANELKIERGTAAVLVNRGLSEPDAAQKFLTPKFSDLPDPGGLKQMNAALEVLVRAIREKRRVVFHGDYDVDGVSGATILTEFFRAVGADAVPFIPNRAKHGYGFSSVSLAECVALGARVIVTCDCGTASVNEIDQAQSQGIEVVVTDHHEPGPVLPRAAALLNPKQPGETFRDANLCGTGVAFFLIIALRRALREIGWFATRKEPNLRSLLDIVAIATIGDVVPLVGINRILVREGLPMLAEGRRIGIAALKDVAVTRDHFDEGTVAFSIVPRINAAGRLGSAAGALELLLSHDRAQARTLAMALDDENRHRQDIEAVMLEQALEIVARDPAALAAPALVLADERWHMGVVGIIAARMVDRFHKPSVVLAVGHDELRGGRFGRGSARGIRKVNLFELLTDCREHLAAFGGHQMAAGMTVAEANIPAFREAFVREAGRRLTADDLIPELLADIALAPEDVTDKLIDELIHLGPHGMSNPEPVMILRNARVAASRIVGGNHLRIDVAASGKSRLETIGFGFGDAFLQLPGSLDLAVVPRTRQFNGHAKTEYRIRDLALGSVEQR